MEYKVAMVSLGCPKNQVDAEQMLYLLKESGFAIGAEESQADAIIVNTCAFIEDAKKEAIENILEAAQYKQNGNCKALIVTGCLAERYKNDVTAEIPEVDVVVGMGSNKNIAQITKDAIEGNRKNFFGEKSELDLNINRVLGGYPFSAYIKIAEGCNNCCTYCAIPLIRGQFRSRKIEDIVAEATRLSENGVTEITVVAQDTTAYGTDIYGKSELPRLLKELCKIRGIKWIRTLYTYPEKITDELLNTVASEEKLVKYFDIPLQHVNGEILNNMNRAGNTETLKALITKIRKTVPGVTLRTTFMVGFPGETDAQFEELCEFVKWARFDRLGCFAYSPEEDTPAAGFANQVEEQLKADRAEIVMSQQLTITEQLNAEKIGSTATVLVEGYDDYIRCYFGRTEADAPEVDGKIFFMAKTPHKAGDYVTVQINDCIDYDLLGEEI